MTSAIVFDLDDTLYPERSFCLSGFRAVGSFVSTAYGVQGFGELCIQLFESGVRGSVFDTAASKLGMSVNVASLVDLYRNHPPEISLFSDVADVLSVLVRRAPLGLITDGPSRTQRNKLTALGVNDLFQSIVISEELGPEGGKPNKRPFLVTQGRLAVPSSRFVYIGDNVRKDFIAPRSLGWDTVRVLRRGAVHPPPAGDFVDADLVVDSLADVPWEKFC
jgi:putative hydrolase of the HAD superfamily